MLTSQISPHRQCAVLGLETGKSKTSQRGSGATWEVLPVEWCDTDSTNLSDFWWISVLDLHYIGKPENSNRNKQLLWPSFSFLFSPCLLRFNKGKQVVDPAPWMEHPGCRDRLEQEAGEMAQEGCWECPGSPGMVPAPRLQSSRNIWTPFQGGTGGLLGGLQGQKVHLDDPCGSLLPEDIL